MGDLSEHFSRVEFACKDGCGFDDPDPELLVCLEAMRTFLDEPIYITSGCRCQSYNRAVEGVENSAHMSGQAADIGVGNAVNRFHIVEAAVCCGASGIGVAKGFIHVDVAHPTLERFRPAVWSY